MPLVDMKDMLYHAHEHRYAVGAFDLVSLDFLEGILAAAEHCRAPVILSLAESHLEHFDLELLMPAVEAAACRTSVPVAIHFHQGANLQSAVRAINRGCNGVRVDTSGLPFEENLRLTRELVSLAHACGVPVEGELGCVPGVEGEDAEWHPDDNAYTNVGDAKNYVEEAGVDFLAISIGTVHGRRQGTPKLDFRRLRLMNEELGIPLVIHGDAGLSDDQFRRLIANGVAKINYYTALADAAGAAVRNRAREACNGGFTSLVQGVRGAVAESAERCMRLWGSAGRAAEVLANCAPWLPVEHLIVYNVEDLDGAGVQAMMAEGRRVLGAIPGVRSIVTGEAVKADADYRYTWLVRFCHPAVIDSYRDHPAHVAFADRRFRPVAGKRITIDYQVIERLGSTSEPRSRHPLDTEIAAVEAGGER